MIAIMYTGPVNTLAPGAPFSAGGPPAPVQPVIDETVNTPGAGELVWPDGVWALFIELWGSGSGGEGGSNFRGGEGGGGGAYAAKLFYGVPGVTYSYSIGAGGAAGAAGGTVSNPAGGNGAASTFEDTVIVASGAIGHTGGLSSTSVGDTKFAGGSATAGWMDANGQGGGSSAGTAAIGATSNASTAPAGPAGSGRGGNGGLFTGPVAAAAGNAPGGGGGGGFVTDGETGPGTAGAVGAAGRMRYRTL